MKRDLLFSVTKQDLHIDFFSGTGKGGQYRNKHQNCVRLRHHESGVIVTGQSHRERPANIREAFNNLVNSPRFKIWCTTKAHESINGKKIEDLVEEMMNPRNLKIEFQVNGKWIRENKDHESQRQEIKSNG